MSDLMKTLGQTMAPQQTAPEGTTWQAGMPASSVTAPYENPATAAPGGGFGGVMQGIGQGIGKVASNPLTLAALQGYARALAMPRGAGPITRTVGGLASGLEDYYVGEPYRQAQMKKIGVETEKGQAETEKAKQEAKEAKKKEAVLEGMSADDQAAGLYPGVARIKAEKAKTQGKQQAAQALVPYYQSQAQALAKTNPPMSSVYQQAADAIAAGADPKDVAASVRVGQQGEHNKAIEGLQQQRVGIEQQNAATSAAHLGVAEQELGIQRQRETREAGQAQTAKEIAEQNLQMRGAAQDARDRTQAAREVKEEMMHRGLWNKLWDMGGDVGPEVQQRVEQRYQEIKSARGGHPQPGQPQPTKPTAPQTGGQYKITSGPHAGEVVTLDVLQQRKAQDPSYGTVTIDPL